MHTIYLNEYILPDNKRQPLLLLLAGTWYEYILWDCQGPTKTNVKLCHHEEYLEISKIDILGTRYTTGISFWKMWRNCIKLQIELSTSTSQITYRTRYGEVHHAARDTHTPPRPPPAPCPTPYHHGCVPIAGVADQPAPSRSVLKKKATTPL